MESGIQSSFIPRDAQTPTQGRQAQRGTLFDIVVLISLVLCIASIVCGVGLFLYKQYLEVSLKSKEETITRAKAAFEPSLVLQLTRLDDRMKAGETLLQNHLAPSTFFHMLDQVTLSTVGYKDLSFDSNDPKNMTLKMSGVAQSLNSIALQADLLSKNGMITSPIFSGINRTTNGFNFSLSALISPLSIRYIQAVDAQQNQGAAVAPVVTPSAPASPFDGKPVSSPAPASPLVPLVPGPTQ